MTYYIKENSFVARMAAWKLQSPTVAIVIGRTVHLHNASKEEFLTNIRWLRHELVHIKQFHRYGFIQFIGKYLLESIKNGYVNNKYEVEARQGEHDETLCHEFPV